MEILSCPNCRTPLRLRERPTQALTIHCPECKLPLEIFENDDSGGLSARTVEGQASNTGTPRRRAAKIAAATVLTANPQRLSSFKPFLLQKLSDPLVVTWMAAGLAATALGIAFLKEVRTPAELPLESPRTAVIDSVDGADSSNAERVASETLEPAPSIADAPEITPPPVPPVPLPAPVVAEKPSSESVVDPRDLIREHLVQRLIRFEQPTEVPFDAIRIQLEELAGVPIRYDASIVDGSQTRQRPVRLVLENATIGTILQATARQANLDVVIEADGIRLITAPSAEDAPAKTATES